MKNSILIDALRQFWIPDIQNCTARVCDIKNWINQAKGYTVIKNTNTNTSFNIRVGELDTVVQAFSLEYSRMTTASIETMLYLEKSKNSSKEQAWNIIMLYYAAFFSGQALIRSMGVSCSHLEIKDLDKINSLFKVLSSSSPTILKGDYKIDYNFSTKTISFAKQKSSSHEAFWGIFLAKFRDVQGKIYSLPNIPLQQKEKVVKVMDSICTGISQYGFNNGNWLSSVRNSVNYKFEHQAWYPFSKQPKYYKGLNHMRDRWLLDPVVHTVWSGDDREIQVFMELCYLIISLNRENLIEMASRSSSNSLANILGSRLITQNRVIRQQ